MAIEGIQELDPPPGDGQENPDVLAALTDGDPTTAWTTVCYESKYLYPKSGVGLVLGLSGPVAGSSSASHGRRDRGGCPSTPPTRPATTWTTGAIRSPGRGSDEPGEATFSLGDSDGRYVLVWLTQLAESDACSTNPYRGAIGELTVEPAG